ncbi:MAG TPA: hypothetical protein DCR23_01760 [Ruminococcaceae bacterium]|nr:hypothetical protein [Oscillospiraceae bacterium]
MKKTMALILSIVLILAVFSGCAKNTDGETNPSFNSSADINSFKTIGDIINSGIDSIQSANTDRYYIYVFQAGQDYYRAVSNITPEISQSLFDLDFDDKNYDSKLNKIISPLEIDKLENLSDTVIPQEELDKLVGKTGEELINDGWNAGMGYNLETMEFFLNKGAFEYTVVFDGKLENSDDFDEEEAIKPLVVKSVTLNGIGDATNVE